MDEEVHSGDINGWGLLKGTARVNREKGVKVALSCQPHSFVKGDAQHQSFTVLIELDGH